MRRDPISFNSVIVWGRDLGGNAILHVSVVVFASRVVIWAFWNVFTAMFVPLAKVAFRNWDLAV
jgi:hypothetical protein